MQCYFCSERETEGKAWLPVSVASARSILNDLVLVEATYDIRLSICTYDGTTLCGLVSFYPTILLPLAVEWKTEPFILIGWMVKDARRDTLTNLIDRPSIYGPDLI